jgi:hypothetical protein
MSKQQYSMSKEEEAPVIDVKPEEVKSPEVVKRDYSKCPGCGVELPPNDDGSPRFRKFPEYCEACIWKDYKKKVIKADKGEVSEDEVRKAREVLERYMAQKNG